MSPHTPRQPKDPALGGWGRYAPAGVPKQFKPRTEGHVRRRIPKQQIDLLRAVPLFAGCTHGELRSIAQLGSPVSVEKGEVLTAQGLNWGGPEVQQGVFDMEALAGNYGIYFDATSCYLLAMIIRKPA